MFKIVTETKLSFWRKALMGLLGMALASCARPCCGPTNVYAYPQPMPADADLQACANHAAAGIRANGDDGFKYLRLDTADRFKAPFNNTVGNTYIATVQDGTGQWFGKSEWRRVNFHCLSDAKGQVLYSFVRAE